MGRLRALALPLIRPFAKAALHGVHVAGNGWYAIFMARAYKRRKFDRVVTLAAKANKRFDPLPSVEGLCAKAHMQMGQVVEAMHHASIAALEAPKSPSRRADMLSLSGRVIETDPRWRPVVNPTYVPPIPSTDAGGKPVVLYVAKESMPWQNNGYCTRSHETLLAIAKAGYSPVAVTVPGYPPNNPEAISSEVEGIEYRHMLPGSKAILGLPYHSYLQLATQTFAAQMQQIKPSLLHVGSGHRGYETALVGQALSRWANVPWVYEVRSFFETTWTSNEKYMENSPYFQRRLRSETRAMHAADLVITLSGPMRDVIVNIHGVDPAKVVMLPNAVDLDRFEARERSETMRASLGLTGKFVLGYVSNLDHFREGQEVLLRAVALLRKQGIDAAALLVGDGRRRTELEGLARKLRLGGNAVFTGNVPFDDVDDYYSQIDLFVVPRVNERAGRLVSPMKPFEAMAMGVPIIVSDLPALVEIAQDDRCGIFRHEDAADLARVASELHADPHKREQMVQRCREWVSTERTWDANARTLAAAYALAHENFAKRTDSRKSQEVGS